MLKALQQILQRTLQRTLLGSKTCTDQAVGKHSVGRVLPGAACSGGAGLFRKCCMAGSVVLSAARLASASFALGCKLVKLSVGNLAFAARPHWLRRPGQYHDAACTMYASLNNIME